MKYPLSPTFANSYMSPIENKILNSLNDNDKSLIYTHYVDGIYVKVRNENYLELIKNQLILN